MADPIFITDAQKQLYKTNPQAFLEHFTVVLSKRAGIDAPKTFVCNTKETQEWDEAEGQKFYAGYLPTDVQDIKQGVHWRNDINAIWTAEEAVGILGHELTHKVDFDHGEAQAPVWQTWLKNNVFDKAPNYCPQIALGISITGLLAQSIFSKKIPFLKSKIFSI